MTSCRRALRDVERAAAPELAARRAVRAWAERAAAPVLYSAYSLRGLSTQEAMPPGEGADSSLVQHAPKALQQALAAGGRADVRGMGATVQRLRADLLLALMQVCCRCSCLFVRDWL